METTINTFSKYKAYKEKRVREFIHKYNAVCWVSWGWVWSGCGICVLMLLALIVHYYTEEELVLFSNIYLVFILIPVFVFTILAGIKYIRSLYVQNVVYDCLKHLSCYEINICYKIKLDTLRDEMQGNNREVKRLKCMIHNLDLKCKMINILIKMNYCKSFVRTKFSKSLDEYNKMIKNKELLLQEIFGYQQLTNKYNADIKLLQEENNLLNKRMQEIRGITPDKEKL